MESKSEWDVLDDIIDDVDEDIKTLSNEQLAAEYNNIRAQHKKLSDRMSHITVMLGSQVNEEPGEYLLDCGAFDVKISRQERYSWDEEKMNAKFGPRVTKPSDIDPLFDKVVEDGGWTVNRARFMKLPDGPARRSLMEALTRKPGSTSIRVFKKGETPNED